MKKITLFLMSLLISVGAMAQVQIQVSTSTTNPQYVYYMKNGNGYYVGAQSKYTASPALFAFFGTNGKYQIYDYTSKQWLTYTQKSGETYWYNNTIKDPYSNGKNFVTTCANQSDAKYFYVNNYSGTNYQIQPYYSNGNVASIYLNYYEGASNNVSLGLYTTNGTGDAGSRWIFEKVELEKSIASLGDLSNDKVYMLKSYRVGGKAVYNSSYPNVAAWNGHSSSSSITEGNAVKWAIYKSSSNKYYVYSIGGGKFWGQTTTNNASVPLVVDVTNDIEITQRSSISGYTFMFSLNTTGSKGIVNASTYEGYAPGLINWADGYNKTDDEGSAFAIVEAGNIDQNVKALIEQKVEAFENPFTVESDKYYRIKSKGMNLSTNQFATVGVQGAAYLSSSLDLTASVPFRCHTQSDADAACIWKFEAIGNAWKIKNVNTNKYISPNIDSEGYLEYTDANNAASFTWEKSSTVDGAQYGCLKFQDGSNTYHLQALGEGARRATSSLATGVEWVILPAEELEVTVSAAGYASIYLPFDVTLPEGLTAYSVKSTNKSYVSLTEQTDIPAKNGAIIAGEGTHTLNIAKATSDWDGNKLLGSNVNTFIQGPAYVLGMKEDGVGLYMAELNKNETGGTGNTHFLNNANKAYLPASAVPQASQVQALFFNVGETTGVEEVEVESTVKTIYDLSGRKVSSMSAPGLYIVNGKKVLVK